MTYRQKRLQKGIESIEEQKKIHLEKKKQAQKLGQEELVNYYDKEIEKFEREKVKKRDKLNN